MASAADVSELRLVLLGNSSSLKVKVGNLLLGNTEFTQHNKNDKCVKVSGTFQDKPVTVINTPDLLLYNISQQEQQQFIQDIKALSAPGPHVFLLVPRPEYFTEEHKSRLQSVLESLREQDFHHSLVLMISHRFGDIIRYRLLTKVMSQVETSGSIEKYMREPHIRELIKRCTYRYLWMDHTDLSDLELKEFKRKELFSRIGDLLKEKDGAHLSPDSSEEEDTGLTLASGIKHKPSLNLVVFGSSGAGKTSAAESILGRAELPAASSPGQCVKHEAKVCGRRVSLVELPALSGEPLETVMEQCLRCISLCAPEGVHAFILVLPLGPLTDEDREEFEILQNTLSAQVRDFTVVLFFTGSDAAVIVNFSRKKGVDLNELRQSCGGGDLKFNLKDQQKVSELLDYLHTFKTKNGPHSFTMETLVQGQREKNSLLQRQATTCTCDQQSPDSLRIALIGKTGSGKSSSGNTILGGNVFETKSSQKSITKVCQKAEAEVEGRRVSVVDTPGLFDTTLSEDEVSDEILKCISQLAPGPHVFLLVLQIGRLTPEEEKPLELFRERFGKHTKTYTIILLTHGDELVSQGILIKDYIEKDCHKSFKRFISECGNRYHVFNNSATGEQTQVKELMKMINNTVNENEGSCYSTQMLLEVEMEMKKNMKRQLEKKEKKIEDMKEDISSLEDKIRALEVLHH